MIVRPVAAVAWALVAGLAGGWLLLSPWSLGLQATGGGWTDATRSVVATGAFLVLIALVGVVVAVADVIRTFRTLGIVQPQRAQPQSTPQPGAPAQPAAAAPADVDMDNLLAALARVLADELSQQREADHELQRREPTWREQR